MLLFPHRTPPRNMTTSLRHMKLMICDYISNMCVVFDGSNNAGWSIGSGALEKVRLSSIFSDARLLRGGYRRKIWLPIRIYLGFCSFFICTFYGWGLLRLCEEFMFLIYTYILFGTVYLLQQVNIQPLAFPFIVCNIFVILFSAGSHKQLRMLWNLTRGISVKIFEWINIYKNHSVYAEINKFTLKLSVQDLL